MRFSFLVSLVFFRWVHGFTTSHTSWKSFPQLNHSIQSLPTPLLFHDTPISDWNLFRILSANSVESGNAYLLSIFGKDSIIDIKQRSPHCHCDIHDSLCNRLSSTFLYLNGEDRLSFWTQYESTYTLFQQYSDCIDYNVVPKPFHSFLSSISNDHGDDVIPQYLSSDLLQTDYASHRIYSSPLMDTIDLKPVLNKFRIDLSDPIIFADFKSNLWMGSNGTVSIRHFDVTQNLYFVIRGAKKFILSPPSASCPVIYPFLHRSARHQYQFNEYMESINGNHPQIKMQCDYMKQEIVVSAGEILYIPPYWFHEVINMDASTVALNLWWSSDIQIRSGDIWSVSIPIEMEWGILYRYQQTMYFIWNVLHVWCEEVHRNESAEGVSSDDVQRSYCGQRESGGYRSRYQMIYPVLNGWKSATSKAKDWILMVVDLKSILKCGYYEDYERTDGRIGSWIYSAMHCEVVGDEILQKKWDESVLKIVRVLMGIGDIGIAELTMDNVFESLLSFVLDENDNLLPLLLS